ncbi:hypothetical protein DM02DRAFT_621161 [Periconia macrospinosa]|uniref:Myb-like domain-containing protein n=1 Tax=Periconia macrospinosa TaxID=97972 RepID=A0A2V1CWL8_9PLEO|nr:hypothetical protein DM02DRAFT_621161 [Periconia macrospinosa]
MSDDHRRCPGYRSHGFESSLIVFETAVRENDILGSTATKTVMSHISALLGGSHCPSALSPSLSSAASLFLCVSVVMAGKKWEDDETELLLKLLSEGREHQEIADALTAKSPRCRRSVGSVRGKKTTLERGRLLAPIKTKPRHQKCEAYEEVDVLVLR